MPQTFHCPACQAPLDYDGASIIVRCSYCNSSVIVPEELRPHVGGTAPAEMGDMVAAVREITALVRGDKKIAAIKLYRETFNVGLAEAKAAVEQLAQGKSAAFGRATVVAPPDTDAVLRDVRAHLAGGRKIEAIKAYRQAFDVGLAEAKVAVEQIERGETVTPSAPHDQAAALARIMSLFQAGNQEEAIRLYRQTFDVSQTGAAKAVEMLGRGESQLAIQAALAALRPTGIASDDAAEAPARAVRSPASCGCFAFALFILLVTVVPLLLGLTRPGAPLFSLWQRVNPTSPVSLVLSFGEEGLGQGMFYDVRSVAVDGDGRIYAADYGSGRLQVFDESGGFQSLWLLGEEAYIAGISASYDGHLYIVRRGQLFDYRGPDGQMLAEFRYPADRSAYFDDVAVTAEGGIWALSDTADLLVRFDGQGQPRQTIDLTEELIPRLSGVDRVDVDGVGNLYLLGTTSDFQGSHRRIFRLSNTGQFLGQFGDSGEGEGLFGSTNDLVVDGQGRIFVADSWVGVQVFDNAGRYLYQFPVSGVAFGLAFDQAGALYAASNTEMIYKYEIRE